MKNHIVPGIFLFMMLCPLFADGQSLAELLDELHGNNLELKALHQESLAALEKSPQVRQLPDPEFGIGAFVLPVETRLGAQHARFGVSQMFPWFGTLGARDELAMANARVLGQRESGKLLELEYALKKAYFKLYEVRATRDILGRNIRILESLRDLAIVKVEGGKGSAADVLRVELKIGELRQEMMILEKQMEKPQVEINQILNRPLQSVIEVRDSLGFATLPFNKDILHDQLRASHPVIRMFDLQQEASRKAIELNDLESRPSFGAGMDYIMVGPRSDAEPEGNGRDILQVSAKVSIPLWREKYSAKEREENLRIEALGYRKDNLEKQFWSMIEKAYADYETAELRKELYARQVTITRSAIRILQADYSSTGDNFDELLRLEMELVDYDLKNLKAIVESQVARASVERYIIF